MESHPVLFLCRGETPQIKAADQLGEGAQAVSEEYSFRGYQFISRMSQEEFDQVREILSRYVVEKEEAQTPAELGRQSWKQTHFFQAVLLEDQWVYDLLVKLARNVSVNRATQAAALLDPHNPQDHFDELMQEIGLKAIKEAPYFICNPQNRRVEQLIGWLQTVCINAIRDYCRQQERRLGRERPIEEGETFPSEREELPLPSETRGRTLARCLAVLLDLPQRPYITMGGVYSFLVYPFLYGERGRTAETAVSREQMRDYLTRRSVSGYPTLVSRDFAGELLDSMRADLREDLDRLLRLVEAEGRLEEEHYGRIDRGLSSLREGRRLGEYTFLEAGGSAANVSHWTERTKERMRAKRAQLLEEERG